MTGPLAARINARRAVAPSPIRPVCAFCGRTDCPRAADYAAHAPKPLAAKRAAAA
jgi:hypothetical protein